MSRFTSGLLSVALMVAALRALGIDVSAVEPHVQEPILGHGRQVGVVRAVLSWR